MAWLLIALGGALGAISRAGISQLSRGLGWEERFPFATLIANGLGCLLIGFAFAWIRQHSESENALRLSAFFVTGYLGSLTTFSTFALQTNELVSDQRILAGLGNVLISLVLGLACVILGMALVPKSG